MFIEHHSKVEMQLNVFLIDVNQADHEYYESIIINELYFSFIRARLI